MSSPYSLSGKRALITGGSRGIGAATSRLLASVGADVCIGYRWRKKDADDLVAELGQLGVRATACSSDLGAREGADTLVGHAVKELGGLDILVHAAGIWSSEDTPVEAMGDAQWTRTIRVNLDATFFVSRAAAKAMLGTTAKPAKPAKRSKAAAAAAAMGDGTRGRIVLIASTAGQRGEAMHADYAASKGAMIAFVKSLAVELAPKGITVNAVAPGWVDTEMCELPFSGRGRERIAKAIPVGRIATPEDIAFPIVSLCFAGARHITGEILNVNGGSVLCG